MGTYKGIVDGESFGVSTTLMFMGRSGSGKSTLERALVEARPDLFHKVTSVTTRLMREGEEDGVDYHFVDDDTFDEFEASGELIQKTEFSGNRYGSLMSQYTTIEPYKILVVVPTTAKSFTPILCKTFPGMNVKNVWFNISDDRLRINMRTRGDSKETIESRLSKDDIHVQYQNAKLNPGFMISDIDLDGDLPEKFMAQLHNVQKLEEQSDLEYFTKQVWKGLRLPEEVIKDGTP